ncbi:hypothetical protein EDD11_008465 [Mortierella claussenii]|nr:hypothetical protein EDD11_008465 [Mortierella claussenii]
MDALTFANFYLVDFWVQKWWTCHYSEGCDGVFKARVTRLTLLILAYAVNNRILYESAWTRQPFDFEAQQDVRMSIVVGVPSVFSVTYILDLNHNIFKRSPLAYVRGPVLAALVIFTDFAEFYKRIKHRVMKLLPLENDADRGMEPMRTFALANDSVIENKKI